MDYKEMALDVHTYLDEAGITCRPKSVALVGHSMGGKTAITLACLFPNLVSRLISLEAAPINRNLYPHLNTPIKQILE